MAETITCPICKTGGAETGGLGGEKFLVRCLRCGEFAVSDTVLQTRLNNLDQIQIAKLSGWIKHQNRKDPEKEFTITSTTLTKILEETEIPSISERASLFLTLAIEKIPESDYGIVGKWGEPDFVSMTYSENSAAVAMLVSHLYENKFILIEPPGPIGFDRMGLGFKITSYGYEEDERKQRERTERIENQRQKE